MGRSEQAAMDVYAKTALVTGSTDGLGQYVAHELARDGFHVLVHGRDRERAESVVASIRKAGGTADAYLGDLSSLTAVRTLAEKVLAEHPRLNLLVNNAGIGAIGRFPDRHVGEDGYELRFTVNYLSGFLLTHLLLARLKASAPARIINVTSLSQRRLSFSNIMLADGYTGARAYSQSKLAQILFTFDLADTLQGSGVTVNCLHPATFMNTNLVREDGVLPVGDVREGGDAILSLALEARFVQETGLYLNGYTVARANPQAYDPVAREILRRLSLSLVRLPNL
jgi:NAD(P)-dependent dehydrogenase (short-subunit alcohol dehydrogenase family)